MAELCGKIVVLLPGACPDRTLQIGRQFILSFLVINQSIVAYSSYWLLNVRLFSLGEVCVVDPSN